MERPHEAQSTVVLAAGSLGKRVSDYANVVRGQKSQSSSLVAQGVLFTTSEDKKAMEKRLLAPKDQPIPRNRDHHGNRYLVHHEGIATVLADPLQTMGNHNGMALRPEFAKRILETDPYAFTSAQNLAGAIVHRLLRQNITGGPTVITENDSAALISF